MNGQTIRRAVEIAESLCPNNLEHRCSHVAILVKKNKIVRIGQNSCKSHPRILDFNYDDHRLARLHAELNVIIRHGQEDLSTYEMISLRINRRGQLANAYPCSGCASAIRQTKISRVYYSDSQGDVRFYDP